jgi:hypothetical protein
MKIRYVILDSTVEPKQKVFASNDLDQIHEKLCEKDIPKEWYVLDLIERGFIADEADGFYDSELTQLG